MNRPDLGGAGLRALVLAGYPHLVIYRLRSGKPPSILRVLHGARDLPDLFGPS